MNFQEMKKEKQRNVFDCVPFCIERNPVEQPDSMHIHDFHQLTIVTKGRGTLMANNISYEIGEGNVYFITSFVPHYLKSTHEIEVVNILFHMEELTKHATVLQLDEGFQSLFYLLPSMAQENRPSNILRLDYAGVEYVNQIVEIMLEELEQKRVGREIIVQSYFMILITFFSREYGKHYETPGRPYEFSRSIHYLEEHFSERITIEDMVRLFQMGEKRLRKLFLQEYHCAPMQYVTNLRLQKARYLLISSDLNVSEISDAVGFEDSNYFSRKFKGAYGVSPREYRAKGAYTVYL